MIVNPIKGGQNTKDATITSKDILWNEVAYGKDGRIVGNAPFSLTTFGSTLKLPEETTWSFCYDKNNSVYYAVGYNSNKIYTSQNCETWEILTEIPREYNGTVYEDNWVGIGFNSENSEILVCGREGTMVATDLIDFNTWGMANVEAILGYSALILGVTDFMGYTCVITKSKIPDPTTNSVIVNVLFQGAFPLVNETVYEPCVCNVDIANVLIAYENKLISMHTEELIEMPISNILSVGNILSLDVNSQSGILGYVISNQNKSFCYIEDMTGKSEMQMDGTWTEINIPDGGYFSSIANSSDTEIHTTIATIANSNKLMYCNDFSTWNVLELSVNLKNAKIDTICTIDDNNNITFHSFLITDEDSDVLLVSTDGINWSGEAQSAYKLVDLENGTFITADDCEARHLIVDNTNNVIKFEDEPIIITSTTEVTEGSASNYPENSLYVVYKEE